MDGNNRLGNYYLQKHKIDSSIYHYQKTLEINMRYRQNIALMKKERSINEQLPVVSNFRYILIGGALILIIVLLITVFISFHIKKQQKMRHQFIQEQLIRLKMENIKKPPVTSFSAKSSEPGDIFCRTR